MSNDSEFKSVLAGSAAASLVARAFTHPLDTVKARLQANQTYKGPVDTFFNTFQKEGLRGLYRGFGAIFIGGTPGTMIYLSSYEVFKKKLSDNDKNDNKEFVVHFCSGMLAETIACIIYVPVDVVKERMQVSNKSQQIYQNSVDALYKILRTEGLRGIYKGYAATLASFGPFSALYFMVYEQFKQSTRDYLQDENLPFHYLVLTSCSAGALASWITSPLDMAKLRLQIQRGKQQQQPNNNFTTYRGVVDCLHSAYTQNGIQGLFRGAGARVLFFAPSTTITMSCYETFRRYFQTKFDSSCH
jgi:hypothetical protein